MSVRPKDLTKQTSNVIINDIAKEYIEEIDRKLLEARGKFGTNSVVYTIPTITRPIVGAEKKDVELVVYYKVIKSLEGRGFQVRIELNTMYTVLYISWDTELTEKKLQDMRELITARLVSSRPGY